MRAKEGEDIAAHINKMRQIQISLHHMGSLVSDIDFSNVLVSSLPQSWDAFTSSFLGAQSAEKQITSQELVVLIRDEYN
jgi:hypothetical protein